MSASSDAVPLRRAAGGTAGEAYRSMFRVARLLLSTVDLEDVLSGIAAGFCEFGGCTRSVIVDYDEATGMMRGLAGYGVPSEAVSLIETSVYETPLARTVLESGQAMFVNDPTPENSVPQRYLDLFSVGGTLGIAPLNSDALGLLGLAVVDRSGSHFRFTAPEQESFEAFRELGALAIQNAILVERSQELAAMLERSRIAADLHDGVTQLLFSASLGLEEVLDTTELPAAARERVSASRAEIDDGARQLRRALFELARPAPRGTDTLALIRNVLDDFSRRTGCTADVRVMGRGTDLEGDRRRLVVRAVAEAVRNVEKHADATEVMVRVRRGNMWWMVDIDDDGVGDPRTVRRHLTVETERFGLYSLSREAADLGGRVWVTQAPRLEGVCLSLSLPVADPERRR